MATTGGIPLSKVSPAFLHANSTSHTWVFSAFAELIDNAYDPDVSASELLIDKLEIRGVECLIFLDNGAGMDSEKLLKMLSFGFCEKDAYEANSSHMPIGHYGNGFKSGSMRIGADAIVFTRCQYSASIGFLSQTYLHAIKADCVQVPILTYRLPNLERIKSQESRNNLEAILKYSVFGSEAQLRAELTALEGSKTGTKIIIYNLKRLQDNRLELDFSSDPSDIRCPEAHEVDLTSVYHRPVQTQVSEFKHSLREYCSILFLKPRMKITIRGSRVKSKLVSKSLSSTEVDTYKPSWLPRPVKIIFGFTCNKEKNEDYGMMLYHRNRLIKAYEKVGYQKQPNDLGVGVVGVARVDFLKPIHNKQDFYKDEKYNSVILAFANKLNDYWNEKRLNPIASEELPGTSVMPDWTWVQCDMCLKWRRLPDSFDASRLPELWYCRMNPDLTHNRCEIDEEPEDEDLAVRPTYEKTFKKKKEEQKRRQLQERQFEEKLRILAKEQVVNQKLALLQTNNPLQRALAEAREEAEQQKREMQEMKKRVEEEQKSWQEQLMQMAEDLEKGGASKTKRVFNQMQQLLSKNVTSSVSMPSSSRSQQPSTFSKNASGKRGSQVNLRMENGEELSIIENIYDDDDDDDDSPPPQKMSKLGSKSSSSQSRLSVPQVKKNFQTPNNKTPNSNHLKVAIGPSGKKSVSKITTPQPSPASSSSFSSSSSSSNAQRSKRKGQHVPTGKTLAIIDLTSDSQFGDFIDIKPDMEELRTGLGLGNVSVEDVKPDKNKLDADISQKGQSDSKKKDKENASPPLVESKKEILDHSSPEKVSILGPASSTESSTEKLKKGVYFGSSEDDPESQLELSDTYQDNLEAAMAAITKKMEKKEDARRQREAEQGCIGQSTEEQTGAESAMDLWADETDTGHKENISSSEVVSRISPVNSADDSGTIDDKDNSGREEAKESPLPENTTEKDEKLSNLCALQQTESETHNSMDVSGDAESDTHNSMDVSDDAELDTQNPNDMFSSVDFGATNAGESFYSIDKSGEADEVENVSNLVQSNKSDEAETVTSLVQSDKLDEVETVTSLVQSDKLDEAETVTSLVQSDKLDEVETVTSLVQNNIISEDVQTVTNVVQSDKSVEAETVTNVVQSKSADKVDEVKDLVQSKESDELEKVTNMVQSKYLEDSDKLTSKTLTEVSNSIESRDVEEKVSGQNEMDRIIDSVVEEYQAALQSAMEGDLEEAETNEESDEREKEIEECDFSHQDDIGIMSEEEDEGEVPSTNHISKNLSFDSTKGGVSPPDPYNTPSVPASPQLDNVHSPTSVSQNQEPSSPQHRDHSKDNENTSCVTNTTAVSQITSQEKQELIKKTSVCHVEVQTELLTSSTNDQSDSKIAEQKAIIEDLKEKVYELTTKLKQKNDMYNISNSRFVRFQSNVYKLLELLLEDKDLGDAENLEDLVVRMLKANTKHTSQQVQGDTPTFNTEETSSGSSTA